MTALLVASLVVVAGGIGGFFNALLTDRGLIFPKSEELDSGGRIWRPGWLGNVLVGALSAFINWGLYGQFTGAGSVGTLSIFVGALLIGLGGSRLLTREIEKKVNTAAEWNLTKGNKLLLELLEQLRHKAEGAVEDPERAGKDDE